MQPIRADAPSAPSPIADAVRALEALRAARPRVHALTNAAAQAFTANLLLAAGAVPSLTIAPAEVPAFAGRADAVLVNLGTLDAERRAAIPLAIAAAKAHARPWLLDPVFVEASPPRLDLARACLRERPTILRCNATEFAALAQAEPSDDNLHAFAREHGTVIALTGPVDRVCDGERLAQIANGHPLMARVTAMGCTATALMAALAAVEPNPFAAAVAALAVMGVAGEVAGEAAAGPGSFQPALLDALHALDAETLHARARVS